MDNERIEQMKATIAAAREAYMKAFQPRNEYMVELYKEGYSLEELSESFGIKEQSIKNVLRYNEIDIADAPEPIKEELRLIY